MMPEFLFSLHVVVALFAFMGFTVILVWGYHLYAKRRILRKHLEKHPEHIGEL